VKVVVVGAGSWGTTFADLLSEGGHDVVVAGRRPPFVPIARAPIAEAELVCIAVPSRAFREVVETLPGRAPRLILTKGLDPESGERLSRVVPNAPVAALSGPNHAEEIGRGLPAAAVLASEDERLAVQLQHELISPRFRVYVNADLVGVELCAASKNVIALAAGAVDGLEAGDNGKAALITRGLSEMARLGEACGARSETFAGLAGMGDLIVTCWSRHSRNRRAGELIARGASPEEAAAEIGQVVEGLTTAPVLRDVALRLGIELPITEAVCSVLGGASLNELVSGLMGRKPTDE
jgi:glycerol-3-phosphate dehydrogenase (NAD(P)+)